MRLLFTLLLLPCLGLAQKCKLYTALNGHRDVYEITMDDLAKATALELKSDCGVESGYKIIFYDVTLIIRGQPVTFKGRGPALSQWIRENAKPGLKIFFDQVHATNGKAGVKVSPLTLVVI